MCDTELSTNEQTRKEKTEAVEILHAEINEWKASISQVAEQIMELTRAAREWPRGYVTKEERES